MLIADFSITGLKTKYGMNPKYDWCGMRARADAFKAAAERMGHKVVQFSHGWKERKTVFGFIPVPMSPDEIARKVLAEYKAGVDGKPFNFVSMRSHSFGLDWAVFFANWLNRYYLGQMAVDAFVGYDGANNLTRTGFEEWWLPESTVRNVWYIFQQGYRPWGVCGWPLPPRNSQISFNVTDRTKVLKRIGNEPTPLIEYWGDSPTLDHCSLITDPISCAMADAFTIGVLQQKSLAALAGAPDAHAASTGGGNTERSFQGPAPALVASSDLTARAPEGGA